MSIRRYNSAITCLLSPYLLSNSCSNHHKDLYQLPQAPTPCQVELPYRASWLRLVNAWARSKVQPGKEQENLETRHHVGLPRRESLTRGSLSWVKGGAAWQGKDSCQAGGVGRPRRSRFVQGWQRTRLHGRWSGGGEHRLHDTQTHTWYYVIYATKIQELIFIHSSVTYKKMYLRSSNDMNS